MKRTVAILLFSLFAVNSNSQNIEGVWIISHSSEIIETTTTTKFENDSVFTVPLDTPVIDTVFNEINGLLNFWKNDSVVFVNLNGDDEYGKWSIINDELVILKKYDTIRGKVEHNQITLFESNDYSIESAIFFRRIKNSKLSSTSSINPKWNHSYWKIKSDSNSLNFGIEYHFLDSNNVIITQDYGDFGYSNWGEWYSVAYGNHYFLHIVNREQLEFKTYHFYDYANENYYADIFEFATFMDYPPILKALIFSHTDFPSKKQIKKVHKNILGTWLAIESPIPFDTHFGYTELKNSEYSIKFKKKTYEIIKKGVLYKQDRAIPMNQKITGFWELSPTGNYIKLTPDDGYISFLTINTLSSLFAEFFIEVRALEENLISITNVKMKKEDTDN